MSTPRLGAAHVMSGTAARLVLGGAGTILIAAMIGPADKGVLATLIAVSGITSQVIALGMTSALPYYVATKKWSLPQSNAVTLAWTLTAGLAAYFGYEVLRATGARALLSGLGSPLLTVTTAAMLFASFTAQALLALKEFRLYAWLMLVSVVANPTLFFVLRGAGLANITSALWAWTGAQLMVAVPIQVVLLRQGGWRLAPPTDSKGALWYGRRSLGSDFLNLVNLRLDVLMLRLLSTASATGAYALVTQLTEVVWVVPTSVGVAVFPEVADGGHEGGAWTARVCRLSSALAVLMCLLVGVAGTLLIVLFLPRYTIGLPALWLLLPGTVAASTGKVLGNDLNARRRPQALLAATAAGVVVTIVGDVTLVPLLGATGAAVVSSVAYTVCTFVLVRFFTSATGNRTREVLPRLSDTVDALRLARRTASELLRRTPRVSET